MTSNKSPLEPRPRGDAVRLAVIAAAERLLRHQRAEFSMRELAAEAGVSFATPFNRFGSKAAIMRALSEQRIDAMEARFRADQPAGDAVARVLVVTDIAVAVMLAEPLVNRVVMGWLGTPGLGGVLAQSTALWRLALAEADGLDDPVAARAMLPQRLAFGFRGVLSFWTAGDLPDADLAEAARGMVHALLTGFGAPGRAGARRETGS